MEAILQVENLKTHFISKDWTAKAIDGISFTVNKEETFGIVGESGCGKSATCRSILRLVHKPGKIIDGKILYNGNDVLQLSDKDMRNIRGQEIGMIFQEPMTSLNPVLKIRDQMYENLQGKGLTNQQKNDRCIELLRLVGIPLPETRLDEYIHQFSGGMRQRVMIATVLAAEPKILLADEPTTALDVTIQDQIIKLLNRLKKQLGMSIILITHDLGVVAQMCDRVAVMYAGHIVETADTVSLLTKPRHPYTYGLLSSLPNEHHNKAHRLESIQGMPPDLTRLPPECPFVPRCKFRTGICTKELPPRDIMEDGKMVMCHHWRKLADAGAMEDREGEV